MALLGVTAAEELKPHEGFKGVRCGASIKDVLKVFPNAYPKPGVSRQHVKLSFDRQESEHMVEVFEERYGRPVKKTPLEVIWQLNDMSIRLVQPEGTVSITSQSYLDFEKATRVMAVKETAKNL